MGTPRLCGFHIGSPQKRERWFSLAKLDANDNFAPVGAKEFIDNVKETWQKEVLNPWNPAYKPLPEEMMCPVSERTPEYDARMVMCGNIVLPQLARLAWHLLAAKTDFRE